VLVALIMIALFMMLGSVAMRLGCLLVMFRSLFVFFMCHKIPLFLK
jgi:hypothetical protein